MHRGLKNLISALAPLALLACIQGCDVEESDFHEGLGGEWTTQRPDGEQERVVFNDNEVTFDHGTDTAYQCPYRLLSFSEKTRTIGIVLTCKKRTGTVLPVTYRLQFKEGQKAFSLFLEDRNVGEYKTIASR
jgi:hypothetical protein